MTKNLDLLASQQSPLEKSPGLVPGSVERAMATKFGMPITGFLCCVVHDKSINCLVGIVYCESRGRFEDGSAIRTSPVSWRIENSGYNLFKTINGSIYVVCEWAQEGGSPQFKGALH